MMYADLPPNMQETVQCSIIAAVKYDVPANILLAIAEKEGGKPGQKVLNDNGSYDIGPMQFNTNYLIELKKFDITAEDVAQKGCYSYELAAWRIRGHILHDNGDIWTRAANYHSRTPYYNSVYRIDMKHKAGKWERWLEAHFSTHDISSMASK